MSNQNQIQAVVHQAIEQVKEVLLDGDSLTPEPDTILLGDGAVLDSMGFVNFTVALEEVAAEKLDWSFSLASVLNTPGRPAPTPLTVAGLVEFLTPLVPGA